MLSALMVGEWSATSVSHIDCYDCGTRQVVAVKSVWCDSSTVGWVMQPPHVTKTAPNRLPGTHDYSANCVAIHSVDRDRHTGFWSPMGNTGSALWPGPERSNRCALRKLNGELTKLNCIGTPVPKSFTKPVPTLFPASHLKLRWSHPSPFIDTGK